MEYPPEIREIATQAADRCKAAQTAVRHAIKNVRAHPAFDTFVDVLVDGAVEELVYQARHVANQKTRTSTSVPKVIVGNSPAVQKVADLYLYRIGGNVLGNMTKEQLEAIGPSERERAAGHAFNARLCEALVPLVPKEKTVQQAVTEKKLKEVWDKL